MNAVKGQSPVSISTLGLLCAFFLKAAASHAQITDRVVWVDGTNSLKLSELHRFVSDYDDPDPVLTSIGERVSLAGTNLTSFFEELLESSDQAHEVSAAYGYAYSYGKGNTSLVLAVRSALEAGRGQKALGIRALGEVGGPEDLPLFQAALADPSASVRTQAAIALSKLGDEAAAREMERILRGSCRGMNDLQVRQSGHSFEFEQLKQLKIRILNEKIDGTGGWWERMKLRVELRRVRDQSDIPGDL